MMACPISAMAPGTNIGAAHPVGVSGAIEQEKVTNDAAAFIRSLAERWDRNADWAEKAVRDAVSVSAESAVQIQAVDLLAPSVSALITEVSSCGAGLPPAGAHRLRHGLATEMLRRGATLTGISQVLRHSDLATTAIYAKVDAGRLREVARPWPGATP